MLEISRQRDRLDALFKIASEFQDSEVQSQLRSAPQVVNFVQGRLRAFQNPKMGEILRLVGSFDKEWQSQLDAATQGQLADSVNSIVSNRHRIAHGSSVALSMSSLREYYRDAVKVVDLLQKTTGVL